MADKYASIELRLNDYLTNGFSKVKSAAVSVTDTLKTNARQVDRLGESYKKIGGAIAAYFTVGKILSFANESIKAYEQEALAIAKLDSALGYSSKALYEHASAMQAVTTYGDESVIEAQALIGSFIKQESQIKRVTEAAMDLAAAKGMDLNSAADLLTKTISSETNALGRYGLQVDGQAGSEQRLQMAVEAVNKAYGGRAKAIADTDVGKISQTRNLISDIQERIGKKILPAQLEWNQAILIGVGWVDKLLTGYQQAANIAGSLMGGASLGRITTQNTIESTSGMKKPDAQALLGITRLNVANDIKAAEKEIDSLVKDSNTPIERINKAVADKLGLGTRNERLIEEQKNKIKELRIESQMLGDALKSLDSGKTSATNETTDSSTSSSFSPNRKLELGEDRQVSEWLQKQQEDSFDDAKKHYEKRIELVKEFEKLQRESAEEEIKALWENKRDLEELATSKAKEEADKRILIAQEEASRINASFTNMKRSLIDSAQELGNHLVKEMFGDVDTKKDKDKARAMMVTQFSVAHAAAAASIWSGAGGWKEKLIQSIGVSAGLFTQQGIALNNLNKYASGGVHQKSGMVQGPRHPADTVNASLTGGEMILNEQQQANLFNMVNQGGSGPSITANFYDNSGNLTETLRTEIRNGNGQALFDELARRVR